jgi:predicted N-formylglutamate amidohydrolase
VPIDAFVVTCEHGGNHIPSAYRRLFRGHRAVLASHRGYDAGAVGLARSMARALESPLVCSTVSRLLVDLNRSIGHPNLFSEMTRALPAVARAEIIATHYRPYRVRAERTIAGAIARGGRVIHVSAHSFTPTLGGHERRADAALLYDPARRGEVALCERWKAALRRDAAEFRIRRNYPYAGKGDGLTAHLRRRFSPSVYIGIELEVNQRIVATAGRRWSSLRAALIETLRAASAA